MVTITGWGAPPKINPSQSQGSQDSRSALLTVLAKAPHPDSEARQGLGLGVGSGWRGKVWG